MTKFLKRAFSLTLASAAAMTIAISAGAATYYTNYKGFYVEAGLHNYPDKTQAASTYYESEQARVCVELTVTDAVTGEVLVPAKRDECNGSYWATVTTSVDKSPIKLSSKHEVIPAWSTDTPWVRCLEEPYVVQ